LTFFDRIYLIENGGITTPSFSASISSRRSGNALGRRYRPFGTRIWSSIHHSFATTLMIALSARRAASMKAEKYCRRCTLPRRCGPPATARDLEPRSMDVWWGHFAQRNVDERSCTRRYRRVHLRSVGRSLENGHSFVRGMNFLINSSPVRSFVALPHHPTCWNSSAPV